MEEEEELQRRRRRRRDDNDSSSSGGDDDDGDRDLRQDETRKRRLSRGKRNNSKKGKNDDESDDKDWRCAWIPSFARVSGSVEFDFFVTLAVVLVVVCAAAENFTPSAYGKFGVKNSSSGEGGGPFQKIFDVKVKVDPRVGWWLMELPCTLVFVHQFFFRSGSQTQYLVPRILATIFLIHYSYRGWIFPMLIRVHKGSKNFDLPTACVAWIVTVLHAYLNAR